ncbi:hydrolase [Leptolyngbya sp. 'hensonii']|uniref:alpha/beta fold hydrolase n=1 Tax=Leptolyngbya sp. 'hensonii' TaxID=1922337 RepID=UPI0009500F5B|nr:alpha/beta fold hydrolase [Leptolyngbya sp. 'hensonii']OLP18724.1 hydrolase [Leptolyngbya sp. 'hensonii']
MATEEHVIEVGGLQWFYREATPIGEAKPLPVLLLHGLPSQSYSWRHVMTALAEQGFRTIAPDWIGFGFSAQPDRRDFAYTPEAFLHALTELLQALQLERVFLVTQGFLGSVGLQYALRYPDRVERLAMVNTPLSTTAKLPWKIQQLGLPLIGDVLTQDPLLVDRTLEGGGPYQVDDADLDVYRRPFLKSSDAGRALLATIQNLQLKQTMADLEAGWPHWQQPTLIVWGIRDPWLPVEAARELANALKQGEITLLDEVGHYAQEDWHEKVSEALIPFFRRQFN